MSYKPLATPTLGPSFPSQKRAYQQLSLWAILFPGSLFGLWSLHALPDQLSFVLGLKTASLVAMKALRPANNVFSWVRVFPSCLSSSPSTFTLQQGFSYCSLPSGSVSVSMPSPVFTTPGPASPQFSLSCASA